MMSEKRCRELWIGLDWARFNVPLDTF